MSSLITIIIPIYNVEKYIHRCINSVLRQTYSNIEIILVDDGSPDGCPAICDEYAGQDTRIKVIHKENGGVGYARNSGLDICSGEFIMFADSDDYLSDDAVEVLYRRLILDGSDVAVGKHIDVYDTGMTNENFCVFMKDATLSKDDIFSTIERYAVSANGKLYKREIFEAIKYPSLKCGEDLWVFPEVIDQCNKISIVNKTIYYYFQNSNSITNKKSEQAKYDELDAILKMSHFLWKRKYQSSAQKYYAKGISRALLFDNKGKAIAIFKTYFSNLERKQLLRGQGLKVYVKWLALYLPIIYTAVRNIKQTLRRV